MTSAKTESTERFPKVRVSFAFLISSTRPTPNMLIFARSKIVADPRMSKENRQ